MSTRRVGRLAIVLALVSVVGLSPVSLAKVGAVPTELLEKARTDGTVRVIVQIEMPMQPEGDLPTAAAVTDQRLAITNAQMP